MEERIQKYFLENDITIEYFEPARFPKFSKVPELSPLPLILMKDKRSIISVASKSAEPKTSKKVSLLLQRRMSRNFSSFN
jgi:hypothetical protein